MGLNNLEKGLVCEEIGLPEYAGLSAAEVVTKLNAHESTTNPDAVPDEITLETLKPFEVLQRAQISVENVNKIMDDLQGSMHLDALNQLRKITPGDLEGDHWQGVFDDWRKKKFISKKQRAALNNVFKERDPNWNNTVTLPPKVLRITNGTCAALRVQDVIWCRKLLKLKG